MGNCWGCTVKQKYRVAQCRSSSAEQFSVNKAPVNRQPTAFPPSASILKKKPGKKSSSGKRVSFCLNPQLPLQPSKHRVNSLIVVSREAKTLICNESSGLPKTLSDSTLKLCFKETTNFPVQATSRCSQGPPASVSSLQEEIEKLLPQYRLGSCIKSDEVSTTFTATDANRTTYLLRYYSLKALRKEVLSNNKSAFTAAKAEVKLTSQLDHPAFLRTFHIVESRDSVAIVSEHATHQLLQIAVPLPLQSVWRTFRALVEALDYLHCTLGIVHGGVRPGSLCLTSGGDLRLTGLTHHIPIVNGCDATYGKSPVAAPEESLQKSYRGLPLDAWGCGLCLFYLCTGRELETTADILQAGLSVGIVALLMELLHPDPQERLTVAELKRHDWVTCNGQHPL